MNIIIGNCAGTFSAVLNYLSWLCVEETPGNNISAKLHWTNKTDFYGNTFYNHGRAKKYQVYEPLIQRENLIDKLFNFRENYFPEDYEEYVESHPSLTLDLFSHCPEFILKYGGGWNINLYNDNQFLPIIRREYNKQWNKLKLSEQVQIELQKEEEKIKGKKVLAIMIRCSKHYFATELFLDNLIKEVETRINEYDNILVLTQVKDFFDRFVEHFGDKCIFPNRERISGDIDWKGGRGVCMSDEEYVKEVEECLIDVFLASKTSHIMSGASNMFLGALSINPEVSFDIFDSLKNYNGA